MDKKPFPGEISNQELKKYTDALTVGDLKKFIVQHDLQDDAKVMVQRVEDVYYERHGWNVYLKEGEHTFKDNEGNVVKESMEQYHPAWSCVRYGDDDNLLFIDLHY